MRVKKFEAKNMKDALQMVKTHLGPDAVILSARDNRRNFGLGGEASVEITAAVSESTLQKKQFAESRLNTEAKQRFQNSDARTQRAFIEKMVDNRVREVARTPERPRAITSTSYIDIHDDEIEVTPRRERALERAAGRNVRELLEDFEQDFDQDIEADDFVALPIAANGGSRGRASARPEARGAGAVSARQPKGVAAAPVQAVPAPVQLVPAQPAIDTNSEANQVELLALKSEIGRLQKILESFQKVPQSFVTMHPGADFGVPFELSFMFQKLTENGLTIDHTVEILTRAGREMDPMQMKKRPIVDAWVARWFLDNTKINQTPLQGRVHIFVGGSGSGKTSTLIKLASHLVVKERKRVAVLSTDSFKVGAVDQMKIYCQILNVPFAVIRNRKDWEWVLGQLPGVDHILVDFPGLQLRDLDEIHLLKSMLPPAELASSAHLCVSATTKDGDAFEIARRYKAADYGDLIVTNLDQSVHHGIITNLQMKTSKPLHSFGIGPRLPEDFEFASKERVLDLMFKLTKLRRDK